MADSPGQPNVDATNSSGSAPLSGPPDPQSISQLSTQPNTQPTLSDATQQQQSAPDDANFDPREERDLDAEIHSTRPPAAADAATMNGHREAPSSSAAVPLPDVGAVNNTVPAVLEPRILQKKDASLREFLGKMDDYVPLIPDAVTDHYLTLAGLPPPPETDRRLARLLALATQKFIADIAADAYQYSRIRSTNTTSNNPLTGLGGAAGFGMGVPQASGGGGDGDTGGAGKGSKKEAGKSQPLGGPRPGYGGGGTGGGQGRTVLTMEDLGMAVGEYGVNVRRGEFYR